MVTIRFATASGKVQLFGTQLLGCPRSLVRKLGLVSQETWGLDELVAQGTGQDGKR